MGDTDIKDEEAVSIVQISLVSGKEGDKEKNGDGREIKDFDDMLDRVNGWGYYQKKLLGIFIPFTFFLAYVGYAPILFLYVPDHWCRIDQQLYEKANSTLSDSGQDPGGEAGLVDLLIPFDETRGGRSQCYVFNISDEEELEEFLLRDRDSVNNDWPIKRCDLGWTYNLTDYFQSASTQVGTLITEF